MIRSREEIERLRRSAEAEAIERLHERLGGMLLRMLSERFGVPADDAPVMLKDVFLSYLTTTGAVEDPDGWLIAAAFDSGVTYRRRQALAVAANVTIEETEALRDGRLLSEAVATLPERAREAVRLRFREQMTYDQIAAELGVPVFYAQNAVKNAVLRLREMLGSGER